MRCNLGFSFQKPPILLRAFVALFLISYGTFWIRPYELPDGQSEYNHPDDIWMMAEFSSDLFRRFFLTATASRTPIDGISDDPTFSDRMNRRLLCKNLLRSAPLSKQRDAKAKIKKLNNIIAGELSVREQQKRRVEGIKQKINRATKRLRGEKDCSSCTLAPGISQVYFQTHEESLTPLFSLADHAHHARRAAQPLPR